MADSSNFEDSVRGVLSDTQSLPQEFVDYLIQQNILNRPAEYRPGQELVYSQITTTVNVTSTSSASPTAVILGSPATYTGNTVFLEFWCPQAITPSAAAGNSVSVGLYDNSAPSTLIAYTSLVTPAAASLKSPLVFRFRFTPTAGTHAYNIGSWATNTTGTPQIIAGSGASANVPPAFLRITKV